jgi:hypothetical protein
MSIAIKDKVVSVIEGKVVITQQTEQKLSKDELIQNKLGLQRRKQQLVEQSKAIKSQYDELCNHEQELDSMIVMLSQVEDPESPEVIPEG